MADDLHELGDEVHGDLNERLAAYDGSMLVKHVTLAEIITADGERQMLGTHSRAMQKWETLGLLHYASDLELLDGLDDGDAD